jgi:hypothetical protein
MLSVDDKAIYPPLPALLCKTRNLRFSVDAIEIIPLNKLSIIDMDHKIK